MIKPSDLIRQHNYGFITNEEFRRELTEYILNEVIDMKPLLLVALHLEAMKDPKFMTEALDCSLYEFANA